MNRTRPDISRTRIPRGFTITELIGALLLLAMASAVMMPLMVSVASQRRAAEQRQWALIRAENLLDEFLSHAWDDVTTEQLTAALANSPVAAVPLQLPGLEQTVAVAERPDDVARQITVELRWHNRAGQVTAPVRLSGWKFAPTEGQP